MKKRANKNIQWAGIDTRNLGARAGTNNLRAVPSTIKQQFYADFGSVIDEWWSLYQNQIHITRNGVKAKVKNGDLSIEMKSDLTVYIGGSKKRFNLDDSLYEIILWIDGQTRNKFAKEKDRFLREKIVRLAYENPSLRKHLLPLVNGKVASNESLELRVTKLAYANSELREHLVPLIKQANFFKKIMEKVKKMFFKNKETDNKVKFDSLPQKQKDEIIESAKEKAEKEQEKADEKKEEEPKKEEKSEKKEEPKKEVDKSNPFGRSKLDQALNILKNYAMSDDTDMDEEQYKKVEKNLKGAPERDLQSYVKSMATYEKEGDPDMDWSSKADKEEKKKPPKDRSNESKTKALKNILNEDKIKKIMEESDLTGYKAGMTERTLKSLLEGEDYDGEIEDVYAYIEKNTKGRFGGEIFEKLLKDLEKELGPGKKKESSLSLRSKLVRLAYQNPSLRDDLLPLITKSANTVIDKQLLRAKEISLKGLGIFKVVGVDKKIGDIFLKEMGGRKEYSLSIMRGGSLLGNGAELKGRGKTRMRTKFIKGKDITVLK